MLNDEFEESVIEEQPLPKSMQLAKGPANHSESFTAALVPIPSVKLGYFELSSIQPLPQVLKNIRIDVREEDSVGASLQKMAFQTSLCKVRELAN